mgnify:CR=1 FL=1
MKYNFSILFTGANLDANIWWFDSKKLHVIAYILVFTAMLLIIINDAPNYEPIGFFFIDISNIIDLFNY